MARGKKYKEQYGLDAVVHARVDTEGFDEFSKQFEKSVTGSLKKIETMMEKSSKSWADSLGKSLGDTISSSVSKGIKDAFGTSELKTLTSAVAKSISAGVGEGVSQGAKNSNKGKSKGNTAVSSGNNNTNNANPKAISNDAKKAVEDLVKLEKEFERLKIRFSKSQLTQSGKTSSILPSDYRYADRTQLTEQIKGVVKDIEEAEKIVAEYEKKGEDLSQYKKIKEDAGKETLQALQNQSASIAKEIDALNVLKDTYNDYANARKEHDAAVNRMKSSDSEAALSEAIADQEKYSKLMAEFAAQIKEFVSSSDGTDKQFASVQDFYDKNIKNTLANAEKERELADANRQLNKEQDERLKSTRKKSALGKAFKAVGSYMVGKSESAVAAQAEVSSAQDRLAKALDDESKAFDKLQKAIIKGNSDEIDKATKALEAKKDIVEDIVDNIQDLEKGKTGGFRALLKPETSKALDTVNKARSEYDTKAEKNAVDILEKRFEVQQKINNLELKQQSLQSKGKNLSSRDLDSLAARRKEYEKLTESFIEFYKSASDASKLSEALAAYNKKGVDDKNEKKRLEDEAKAAADAEQEYGKLQKRAITLQRTINTLKTQLASVDKEKSASLYQTIQSQIDNNQEKLDEAISSLRENDKDTRDAIDKIKQMGEAAVERKSSAQSDKGSQQVIKKYVSFLDKLNRDSNEVFKDSAYSKANDVMDEFRDGAITASQAMQQLKMYSDAFTADNKGYNDKVKLVNDTVSAIQQLATEQQKYDAIIEKGNNATEKERKDLANSYQKIQDLKRSISTAIPQLMEYDASNRQRGITTNLTDQIRSQLADSKKSVSDNLSNLVDAKKQSQIESQKKALEEYRKVIDKLEDSYSDFVLFVQRNSSSAFASDAAQQATDIIDRYTNGLISAKGAMTELNEVQNKFNNNLSLEKSASEITSLYSKIAKSQDDISKIQKKYAPDETIGQEDQAKISALNREINEYRVNIRNLFDDVHRLENQFGVDVTTSIVQQIKEMAEKTSSIISGRSSDALSSNLMQGMKDNYKNTIHEAGANALSEYTEQLKHVLKLERERAKLKAENDQNGEVEKSLNDDIAKSYQNLAIAEEKVNYTGDIAAHKDMLKIRRQLQDQNERDIAEIKNRMSAQSANSDWLKAQASLYKQLADATMERYNAEAQLSRLSTKRGMTTDNSQYKQASEEVQAAKDRIKELNDLIDSGFRDETLDANIERIEKKGVSTVERLRAKERDFFTAMGQDLGDYVTTWQEAQDAILAHLKQDYDSFDIAKAFDGNKLVANVKQIDGTINSVTYTWDKMNNTIRQTEGPVAGANASFSKLGTALSGFVNQIGRMVAGYMSINAMFNAIKQGVGYVRDLDKALTELQLVTQANDETISQFAASASEVAQQLAMTTEEVIRSQTEWARLGYNAKDALDLATAAAKLATAGFMSAEDSTSQLTSAIQAFYAEDIKKGVITAGDAAMEISDKMVYVGKEFAHVA